MCIRDRPCATQNDVDLEQAKRIVANNIKYYIEVANMPTTNEALKYLICLLYTSRCV